MAENLIGSEIIKLAGEINEKIKKGEKVFNFTIGDFDPSIFPIPAELTEEIIKAYHKGHTNYPPANGIAELRKVVADFLADRIGLKYSAEEVLISGGARPLIYGIYVTLLNAGDKVIVPLPSWNNNHYCHLVHATPIYIEAKPENNFMPTAEEIKPFIGEATLLTLCSPLNPTGTVFSNSPLKKICEMVLEENKKRKAKGARPLYVMYDQIYWMLTYGATEHYNPVSLMPEMAEYTIFVDGISKSLAATGIRVGWAFGPRIIIDKMKSILSHVGAWAPKADQVAGAKYLAQKEMVDKYLENFKERVDKRLESIYKGFMNLKNEGFKVDAIAPQAAIYLTIKLDLKGLKTASGEVLKTQKDVTHYILEEARLAVVPFSAFGASDDSPWYRLSVGTCNTAEIPEVFDTLRKALKKLT